MFLVGDNYHSLLLCRALPLNNMLVLVLPDLNSAGSLCWWLVCTLRTPMHLSLYYLQQLLHRPDRAMKHSLCNNAVFKVFFVYDRAPGWHAPDLSKIETIRLWLSPATKCALANVLAKWAFRWVVTSSEHIDMDSEVPSPDMSYAASAHLIVMNALWSCCLQKLL